MGTIVERLARWARDLQHDDLPPSVRSRARLQQLSAAGAVRGVRDHDVAGVLRKAGATRGRSALVSGGTAPLREAVRFHAALGSWLDHDDHLVFGNPSAAATAATWAAAKGHTVEELLVATVAANEVAGRVGASMLIGPTSAQATAAVHSAAAVVALGLLEGLEATQLAHALAIALSQARRASVQTQLGGGLAKALMVGTPAMEAVDAVELARAGGTGPLDVLDDRDGILGVACWVPLRAAFTGLGKAWLTQTLAYGLMPVHPTIAPAVQCVEEVLRRHVKAAEKRLRVNQLDRIEVRLGAAGFTLAGWRANHPSTQASCLPTDLRSSIGLLLAEHALGPAELSPELMARKGEDVAEVASKTEVVHDWSRTLDLVEHFVDTMGPLMAGVTSKELRTAGLRASGTYGALPKPGAAELIAILRRRPGRMMESIRYSTGDLADARIEEWQPRYGADVRVFTTRGGNWPEGRDVAWGAPGWAWDDTVHRVHAKWAQVDPTTATPEQLAPAQALADTSGSEDATGFVAGLLGLE